MLTAAILDKVEYHVRELFREKHQPYLIYHNILHTTDVANRTIELTVKCSLSDQDARIALVAAWFHDTGHLFGEPEGHEEKSVIQMRAFFEGSKIDRQIVDQIARCIMATKMPTNPGNVLEQVICDADTYHVGTKEFWNINCTVWMEKEALLGYPVTDWKKKSITFLEEHRFFTPYCKQQLDKGKADNLQLLYERLNDGKGPCLEP